MSDPRPPADHPASLAPRHARPLAAGRGYAVAVATVAAATLLMFAFYSVVGLERGRMPFVFYFVAVMLSARFGGRGPGLLSLILSTLAADFFFLRPFSFLLIALQSVVFVLVALLIVVLTEKSRRAEAAARATGESLSTMLRSIGDAVIATDAGGCVTYMNPVAEGLTGWKAMEARGRPLAEVFRVVNEETRAEVDNPVDKALREGAVVGLANHTLLITKDGAEIPIDDSGAPIKDESGAIVGVVLVFHDITERRRAEEAQRENEERLRAITETASDAIITIDEESRILFVNSAAAQIFGYTIPEMIGHDLTMLMPDYLRRAHEAALRNYVVTGRRHIAWESVELPGLRKDGREISLEISFAEFKQDGRHYFTGVARDITERRKAERALRESEESYRALADAMPQIIWTARADGYFDYYNKRWFDYTGMTLEQTRGWGWQPVLHPDDVETCLRRWATAVQTGEEYEIEYRFRRAADGEYRWHLGRAEPLRDAAGRVVKWFGAATDIHDQKQTEERVRFLAEANALLASSLDYEMTLARLARLSVLTLADHCLIDVIGDDGQARRVATAHADPAKEELVSDLRRFPPVPAKTGGIPEALLTGRSKIVPEVTEEIMERLARGDEHLKALRRLGPKSFMTVPLNARGGVIGAITFGLDGPASGRRYTPADLAFAEDLARRAALAIDNARLYSRAQESNRAKDEFLATLSHELRTPLTPIVGWAQMLRHGHVGESSASHALEAIDKNSQSLLRLINDLLDMTSILSGKMKIARAPVELAPVVLEAVETIRPQANMAGVTLDARCDGDGAPALVSGDRTRLAQIFWNLLSNAVKFSRAGGSVRVTCGADAHSARVEVLDEGVGIEREFLPRVFERFSQADGSTTRAHGGLGLGLALVKSFVEAHGGAAQAFSAGPGQGSRFTVTLPLLRIEEDHSANMSASDKTANPVGASPPSAIRDPPSVRVLLIEDANDTLDMLRVVFKMRGYEVVPCASAEEALRVAPSARFDIIVSDIGLPRLSTGQKMIFETA